LKEIEDASWTCTIVWEGNQEKNLKNLTQTLWLEDRIVFVWADDRTNWLHRFDIFVNPSYQEWLPTTVVEALMAGCVVVATDVGGTREISDGEDLLLIQSGDSKKLSENIEKTLELSNFSNTSSSIIQEKFSLKWAIHNYNNTYKKLISKI